MFNALKRMLMCLGPLTLTWKRGGHVLFGFQTYFLQCLSNYSRCKGFSPIAVFTPRLNGISKAETSSSSIPFCLHFRIHHLPSYIASPFCRDFQRTIGTQRTLWPWTVLHCAAHQLFIHSFTIKGAEEVITQWSPFVVRGTLQRVIIWNRKKCV